MTSGIVAIQFNSDASDDEIMTVVRKIYSENMVFIKGMQYREFEDDEPITKTLRFIDEMDVK